MTLTRVHLAAAATALTLVACFLLSSAAAELVGDEHVIRATKTAIVIALLPLIAAMAASGASGRRLARGSRSPSVRRKLRRTVTAALTGVLVLVPCAVVLYLLARDGEFGARFTVLQVVEFAAGTSNLALLARNARDGRRLSAGRRRSRQDAVVATH